jgi:voltage-gated potassium channel
MPTLKQIIESSDTKIGKAFDLFIQALIVLSLISFSIETLPNLPSDVQRWLYNFELISIGIFTIEYILRTAVASKKTSYIFSFWGLIDLAAILPFYIGTGIDLRSIRAFRLLRLFRIFKLARYNAAIRRFHLALKIAKEEIILFLGMTSVLLFLSAVGIYYFENEAQPKVFGSVFHALWWAVTTLTTVGYGDAYPVTVGGRLFTTFILLIGLGIISAATGIIASALSKARELDDKMNSNGD